MKKDYIIKKAEEFNEIINNGKKISGKIITIFYLPSPDEKIYFGFAVGKKIGNAVKRNKVKRKIKNIINSHKNLFKNSNKYIIMLRRNCLEYTHEQWIDDINKIIEKVS